MTRPAARSSGPARQRRWSQVRFAPFEAAIAAIVVVQAVIGFAGGGLPDPIAVFLPDWMTVTFKVLYLMAGLLILAGMSWPRADVEGCGLVLLSSVLLARGVIYGQFLGWGIQSVTSLAFVGLVALAAGQRIVLLRETTPHD